MRARSQRSSIFRQERKSTHPHGSVESTGNLVVLLEPRAAAQDLWEPELAYGTLHVANLALGRRGSLDPLGGLATNTAHHVGVGESLGGPLLGLHVKRRGDRLGDARVQRRGPAGDDQVAVGLIAGDWPAFAVARPRTLERGVCGERGRHFDYGSLVVASRGSGSSRERSREPA